MGVSEILRLLEAGYTKDEIQKMSVEAVETPSENPDPGADPVPDPDPEKEKTAEPDEKQKEIEKLKAQVKELQAAAAAGARQEKKTEKLTADKAIRDFISSL